jgi:hypothetical protein
MKKSGARATHNVSASRARDAPSAAHTRCGRAALPSSSPRRGRGESGASAARNVSVSRARDAPSAAHTWCGRAAATALPFHSRGRGGARVERAPHATCPSRALATRRWLHTHGAAEQRCPPHRRGGVRQFRGMAQIAQAEINVEISRYASMQLVS